MDSLIVANLVFRPVANATSGCGRVVLVDRVGRVCARNVVVHYAGAIAHLVEVVSESVAEITQCCRLQFAVQIYENESVEPP